MQVDNDVVRSARFNKACEDHMENSSSQKEAWDKIILKLTSSGIRLPNEFDMRYAATHIGQLFHKSSVEQQDRMIGCLEIKYQHRRGESVSFTDESGSCTVYRGPQMFDDHILQKYQQELENEVLRQNNSWGTNPQPEQQQQNNNSWGTN